jgi:transcriptional regulator with XRE-family HTH domain
MASTSATATALAPIRAHPLETQGHVSGEILRALRQQHHLTLRQVAAATQRIAGVQDNEEFSISPGRLSEIENKGAVPSIFRLYSLATVYQVDLRELISWFGVPRE